MNPETAALHRSRTASTLLAQPVHVDQAVDAIVDRYGWDTTFQVLAAMEGEPRAAEGLYSLVCTLFLEQRDGLSVLPDGTS